MKHINNLRFHFEKNQRELNEMKNLLKEYSLMEDEDEYQEQPKKRTVSASILNEYRPEDNSAVNNMELIPDELEVFHSEEGML